MCVVTNNYPRLHFYGIFEEKEEEKTAYFLPQLKSCDHIASSFEKQTLSENISGQSLYKLESEMRSGKFSLKTQKAYIYSQSLV